MNTLHAFVVEVNLYMVSLESTSSPAPLSAWVNQRGTVRFHPSISYRLGLKTFFFNLPLLAFPSVHFPQTHSRPIKKTISPRE